MNLGACSWRFVRAGLPAGLACAGLLLGRAEVAARSAALDLQHRAEADALFSSGALLSLRLDIPKAGLESLGKEPNKYVPATLWEGATAYSNVAVKLKGSSGSHRPVNENPGLTLNLSLFEPGARRFHGLHKFHLNNSVQDPSYFSEFVCNDLFRKAGVPAPYQAHALVELNGRKLGLHVLLESMDKEFLSRYFKDPRGNLYGQRGGGDVTDSLERMNGDRPLTRDDLATLAAAVQEKDADRRAERLHQTLDVDRFLSFMALEVMFCHWDGYTFARHNYRVYQDLDTGRMVFFPHDLDQMFRDPDGPVVPGANGLVAQAVLSTPQLRSAYRHRVRELFTNTFVLPVVTNQLNARLATIQPALKAYDLKLAREVEDNVANLKGRILARWQGLAKQLSAPVATLKFDQDTARLAGWRIENEQGGARLEQGRDGDGRPTFRITATASTTASWRTKAQLAGGRYRFEGRARSARVEAVPDDKRGAGAGLRISGNLQPRQNKLEKDSPWQLLACEFEVPPPNDEIELVCELRATQGDVWFDADSLRLVRLK